MENFPMLMPPLTNLLWLLRRGDDTVLQSCNGWQKPKTNRTVIWRPLKTHWERQWMPTGQFTTMSPISKTQRARKT